MFGNSNDDEELFPSNVSSNLAHLFGGVAPGGQTDLKYTAPRQPKPADFAGTMNKPDETKPNEGPKISVVCAKVVLATKFINNTSTSIGKLGFALLGTPQSATQFLLYRDKQNIITKVTISSDFVLEEEDKFFKFSDNTGVEWITQFTNNQDHLDFTEELMIRNVKIKKQKSAILNKIKKDTEEIPGEDTQIRADILNRMARMGQSVLPAPKVESTKQDDTRKVEITHHLKEKEEELEKIQGFKSSSSKEMLKPIIYPKQYFNPYLNENNTQIQPYSFPMYQNQQADNQDFRMFVSENRMHNSEVRINLTTISSKIDTVLNEISKLKISPNTDRLENEFLKSKIADMEQQIQSYSSDNSNLQELKRKIIENESESKIKQEEIRRLNQTNQDLESALKKKLDEFDTLEKNQNGLSKEIEDLTYRLNEMTTKCKDAENRLLEVEGLQENLMGENKRLQETNEKLSIDLNKEGNKENVDCNVVKTIMNQMFQNILGDFEGGESANYKEIKSSLSKHMKQATFNIIDVLEKY